MRYLVLLLLVINSSTFSQINSNTSPEEISSIAMVALEDHRYEDFASLMHPDALTQMRDFANLILSISGEDKSLLTLFGVKDSTDFHTISDTSIMAKFMEAVMSKLEDKVKIKDMSLKILGSVMEGADTIHIVTRSNTVMNEISISTMEITSLKQSKYGWRLLIDEQIQGYMTVIRTMIDSRNKLR